MNGNPRDDDQHPRISTSGSGSPSEPSSRSDMQRELEALREQVQALAARIAELEKNGCGTTYNTAVYVGASGPVGGAIKNPPTQPS